MAPKVAALQPVQRDLNRPDVVAGVARVRDVLDAKGVLLRQDAKLPSATTLIVGEPIRGSWWGHPANKVIYDVMSLLEEEVAWVKLLCGKVTLVHARLWSSLVSVAMSEDEWQTRGLSTEARRALMAVDGAVRSDQLTSIATGKQLRELVSELERRLLVHAEDIHTQSGHHVRLLMPWSVWCERKGIASATLPPPAVARNVFEQTIAGWSGAWLPWTRSSAK